MLNIITLCVSIAFNDVPAETVCKDVATDLTPNQVALAYIATVKTEAFDTVWYELRGNLVHVALNTGTEDE